MGVVINLPREPMRPVYYYEPEPERIPKGIYRVELVREGNSCWLLGEQFVLRAVEMIDRYVRCDHSVSRKGIPDKLKELRSVAKSRELRFDYVNRTGEPEFDCIELSD